MTANITPNTDFSNVTITNDYPCLVGGTWTASLNSNNETVYTNGDQTYTGPVNLIGGTLIVSQGAVVNSLTAINDATITVDNGGTIKNSDVFSANVTINDQGTSSNNNYVSSNMNFNEQSTSSSDFFYYPGSTGNTSGKLISQLPDGSSYSFQTSNGSNTFSFGDSAGNITLKDPHFPDISANNSNAPSSYSNQSFTLTSGSQFGNTTLAPTTDYGNNKFRLSNDYKTYVGGDWTASLTSDNKTVYSNGSITVEGPINLVSANSLTINKGAVVDGITITSLSNTTDIMNYGTIQNSFITNGSFSNQNGGISKNNIYISEVYTGNAGSLTSGDMFYSSRGASDNFGSYDFTNMPSNGATAFVLDDGFGMVTLFGNAQWDNSYIGTDASQSGSKITINRYYNSDIACFLAGTMIKTVNGYIAIEDIQIGDEIIVFNGQSEEVSPVIWKGYNNVHANNKESYPVRILKDAIDQNVPCQDLLVTPEHCLFFENQFIPVYMLVNETSIFFDQSIQNYTYYHIETEPHSVIIAQGVLTESYLDTGNRYTYHQSENVINIHNKKKAWNIDSAAPLQTKRAIVEPIFNQIVGRIPQLGLTYTPKIIATTNDNDLHLHTDKGEDIYPINDNKEKLIFQLPLGTNFVRLISKTSRPSDTIGSFTGDRRKLGVLVGNVVLIEPNNFTYIDNHLTFSQAKGWDSEMPPNCRWTNGDAYLELPNTNHDCRKILMIEILDGGPYQLESSHDEASPFEAKVS